MNAVMRPAVLDVLTDLDHRAALDAVLAEDQWHARRAQASSFEHGAFASLSDLELACAYEHAGDMHDAIYCELHLRRLTPWKLQPMPALDATP